MKICVTGGAGYIGDSAVHYLLNNGHQVTVLDNLTYGQNYLRQQWSLSFVRGDIRDKDLMASLIKEHDAIIHLAAIVGDGACAANPEQTIEINLKATQHIAEQCKELNKKLVFASTCSVYGANNSALNELSETNPLSLYAGTKLEAEKFVKEVPSHYIFRLGTLYGLSTPFARLRTDLVVNILSFKGALGQKLTVYGGEQYRPLLHVKDAGEIMAKAAVLGNGATFNSNSRYGPGSFILSERNSTILEIAEMVQLVSKIENQIEVTSMPFEDQRNYRISADHKGAIWMKLRSLIDGVTEMMDIAKEGRIANLWDSAHNNAKFLKDVK